MDLISAMPCWPFEFYNVADDVRYRSERVLEKFLVFSTNFPAEAIPELCKAP
jgi:hypothetical protein